MLRGPVCTELARTELYKAFFAYALNNQRASCLDNICLRAQDLKGCRPILVLALSRQCPDRMCSDYSSVLCPPFAKWHYPHFELGACLRSLLRTHTAPAQLSPLQVRAALCKLPVAQIRARIRCASLSIFGVRRISSARTEDKQYANRYVDLYYLNCHVHAPDRHAVCFVLQWACLGQANTCRFPAELCVWSVDSLLSRLIRLHTLPC